jgi:tetratricopeptide (TPR) repeat protein
MKVAMAKENLGRVAVQRKALRIDELGDRVSTAIGLYKSAQKKFEVGQDSQREWENIIKVLQAEIEHVRRFIAVAHHNLGVVFAGRHQIQRAKVYFEQAIEIDPDYAVAYHNLAVIYKNLGDLPEARRLAEKAKELGYPPPTG